MSKNYLYLLSLIFFITSCGGGGGGSSEPSVPAPTVSISLSSSSIVLGESVTINWSSSNASSCNANGSWSGSKATSGTESITPSGVGFFNYGISCSGSGGSRSSSVDLEVYRQTEGVSVDGYIRGAEIFIDKNNNFIADMGDENSTSSDNEGKFTIKYDDGNLISLGGIDLDTGNTLDNFLINQNLSGYSEFKVITPVTSVASFLNESTSINNVLGIDSSIDIFTFDPVANTGDGGINDYLYEKGNQLTVLAFSLQNIINNINSTTETTQDYFKSIAEEIDLEYAATSQKVDIETSNFVLNVLNNITIAKGVTLDEANKDNTVTALSGLLPIIEVKPSQDLTNSIFNFSTTTLQTDILTIADGTASEEVLTNYTTNIIEYIAQDQNIDSDEITPAITAINDSAETEEDSSVMINVIVNDSYITTAPISVLATNGSNGTTSLVESSPEQVVYSPNPDFNGTDSFSYTITQGDKTSSADVSLTVSQVQDDPVINISSSISTPENILSVTTISISDVDDDELTLTLSGADADAFNLSNENELSFKELPDYESKQQYALTLSLTDGNTTVTKDITILVTNVNDVAPVITSSSTFSASENQTFIGSVEASDVEGDDITFSISGTEISISSTGVLSFISAPDYESKTSYSATVTVSDGELIDTQDLIVSVLNVNDNSPVITSGSGFSVNENVSTIGTVQASDVDNDALAYSVTGSELQISNSGLLSFSDSNGADFESQSSYIAEVSVFDGVFTVSQTIIITVNDINDNTPIISSSSLTPNENLVIIGSVSATDGDADSTLSFSISGADTLKDDRIFLEIDSKSGEISIASGRGVLDYETKSSYTINVTVSDGENSSTSPVTIDVQNILEDLIDYTFSISDGTAAVSPVLSVNATFDELTFVNGGSAYVALFSTGLTPIAEQFGNLIYPACAGTLGIYEMTSNDDRTSWSLIETLSDELSDLCTYTIELLINTNSETSDPSPPTDSIHRQTGNNRYANKPIQFEMYHWFDGMGFSPFGSDDPDVLYSNAVTIANPLADNIIDTADGGSLFLYSDDTYPSECSVNSYNVTITDALGFSETLTTPQVAFITADCLNAMAFNNISSVGGKFNFSIDVYSIEPMSLFKGYMYMPYKTNPGDTGNGGQASAELLTNNGTIRGDDNRIANLSFEFDREAAPSGDLDNVINTDGILYFEAIDESSLRIDYYYSSYEMNIPQVNGDADETAPLVNSISTSSFTDSNYPQRNFVKFEVDVTNNASSNGTITPIKDIWISFTGGPSCANRVVYVRDELDGKLDTSTSLFTATVPFLKSDEGTYMIDGYNINDHGYAESFYAGSVNHIGDTFTVGNDIDQTCPLFTQNYGSGSITVDVEENTKTIGTFPATGPSADTITYSLVAIDSGSGSIIDLVTINSSTGELSYKDSPDYEGDITYSGSVGIKAQYYNTLARQLNVTVNLINLNDNAPVFTSSATLSADENQTAIGCVSVTDADAVANPPEEGKCATTSGITFTVSGDNLEISADGRLSFTLAPDYETKSLYTGNISASDGVNSTIQDITININDLNDNDPVVGNSSFTVNENQLVVGQVSVTDQDTNNTFTYSIVSDYEDGAKFAIDTDGNITFVNNPDFENQSIYKLKVNVSDGQTTVVQEYTVTLNDVIAEAIPTFADINLLPKTINSSTIQLQSFVVEGRIATFSIEQDASFGTSSLNSTSGELLYQTSSTDVATDELTFKVNDGAGNESTAKLTINLNTDPLYKYQWHLDNTGQTNFASTPGVILEDMNIKDVIASGYTGSGLTISVIDEGLEIAHEDLAPNVLTGKSYNFLDGSNDPTSLNLDGDHGTSVAGIIASKGWNNIGGRGVAPNANLVGYNYLESQANSNESYSLGLDNNLVSADIFNMSYGRFLYPSSNNFSFPTNLWGPSIVLDGFINGVNNLRNGKGGIYIKSMGNDYSSNATNGSACGEEGVDEEGAMTCGIEFHDFRHLHPYIIGVGALGADGIKSSYSTVGPSIWVSSPGGEYGYNTELGWSGEARFFEPAIMTTDQSSCDVGYVSQYSSNRNAFNNSSNPHPDNPECKYTSGFNGTSSAAPNVAGGIAVLLEAYPNLTWREVKHVIANSSRKIDVNRRYERSNITQYEWRENAAGYNFHNWYGFGAFDLEAALEFSSNFILNSLGTFSNYGWTYSPDSTKNQLIPSFSLIENSIDYQPDTSNNFVEFIQLAIYLTKDTPRDLGFSLVSPQGTEMNIIQPFTNVSGNPNGEWFVVGISGFYGENLKGEWKLKVIDYTNNGDEGILNDWGINIYGN